ncbi:hypothetical protein PI124_g5329 [Phytophthora idaei]|nr:hypothetical protein PI125_g5538 [Phytophthora idaei]KAG3153563.1 hypothetical protein PI126_g10020 [Phytophthora idaei]KAG3250002.1 hypothetical protein PI124_g5329 [Phytophthora idaei]
MPTQQLDELRASLAGMHQEIVEQREKRRLQNMTRFKGTECNFSVGDFVLWSRIDSRLSGLRLRVGCFEKNGEVKLLLTVYVDDLLLMGPRDLCAKIAAALQETFELTTMGTVKYLLGIEILIDRPNRQIIYCQKQYVSEVLKRFHMSDCNGCATPEATTPSTAVVSATKDYLPYRELVCALQYLVNASGSDIAHATRVPGHLRPYTLRASQAGTTVSKGYV